MNIPHLQTERTRITLLQTEQAALLLDFVQRNRSHLAPWEPVRDEKFFTLSDCQLRIEKSLDSFQYGASCAFVALTPDGARIIATCNLSNIVQGVFQACHLGYSICHEYEGQGLMHEVAARVVRHAFEDLKLHRVMASYMPRNLRSERVLQKLGFEREGYARSYLKIAGQWEDHVLTALINPTAM